MDKGLYLNAIATYILPNFIYNNLAKEFVVGYNSNGYPVYDTDKAYEVLSNVEELKIFDDNYDELHELVEHGRIREAISIAKRKQQAT